MVPVPVAPSTLVGRAFHLLRVLSAQDRTLALSDLARQAGLPKSTTHRLVTMLTENGAVLRSADGYRTAWRSADASAELRENLFPSLLFLYKSTNGAVHLALPTESGALVVEKLADRDTVPVPSRTGALLPAHSTALGKVLLAHGAVPAGPLPRYTRNTLTSTQALHAELEQVRHHGLAYDREEYVPGVSCVAAPVFDQDSGQVVAAISVSATPGEIASGRVGHLILRALMRTRRSVGSCG
ncbi:IclR family transcriptional regulator [Lentzea sp. NBRC 105346]|uniref:IclR family transcriptional regulator n=1 Tax=Lentzea sp. NBRC 105346 TaxID=3032205 RepID=UPI002553E543|nr:IclR family transcriptional regulator [Lentzea sp. NBRC 105346]GLZ33929.1 IclR family transcriptional regulator [Lentzea sp. NBRC 105346]